MHHGVALVLAERREKTCGDRVVTEQPGADVGVRVRQRQRLVEGIDLPFRDGEDEWYDGDGGGKAAIVAEATRQLDCLLALVVSVHHVLGVGQGPGERDAKVTLPAIAPLLGDLEHLQRTAVVLGGFFEGHHARRPFRGPSAVLDRLVDVAAVGELPRNEMPAHPDGDRRRRRSVLQGPRPPVDGAATGAPR